MQLPTLANVNVRTTEEAHKLFYAVELGRLPKIEKRLNPCERAALRSGNIYVWEEKPPKTDDDTTTIQRFTDGKAWTSSKKRCVISPSLSIPITVNTAQRCMYAAGSLHLQPILTFRVEFLHVPRETKEKDDSEARVR